MSIVLTRERRRGRGYVDTERTLEIKRRLAKRRAAVSMLALCADHVQIAGLAVALAWLWQRSALLGALLLVPAIVLIGRAMRGLEAMTHEASHGNLFAGKANDRVADLFAALPMWQAVSSYRRVHLAEHHGAFGTSVDPCAVRYESGSLMNVSRTSYIALLWSASRQIVPSLREWYRSVGTSRRDLRRTAIWHVVYWALFASVLDTFYFVVLVVMWIISATVSLPLIRIVGEADEHDYKQPSEFWATYSMISPWHRFMFHPHGDGFHAEHHRYPRVPHHALAKLRKELLEVDPSWKDVPTHDGVLWKERNLHK